MPWRLVFMGPQYGTCFTPHFWQLEVIEMLPRYLENFCTPDIDIKNYLRKPLLHCAECYSLPAPWVSYFCFKVNESGNIAGKCYMCLSSEG